MILEELKNQPLKIVSNGTYPRIFLKDTLIGVATNNSNIFVDENAYLYKTDLCYMGENFLVIEGAEFLFSINTVKSLKFSRVAIYLPAFKKIKNLQNLKDVVE